MRKILALLIFCLGYSSVALADKIVEKMPNGLYAFADYHKAEPGKPTLLIMHPFLQTSSFSVIANLAETLTEEGFGVFMPTLSLGVDGRKQGKSCEAIHTQTFLDSENEVLHWLNWLKQNQITNIIATGHSSGASLLASLMAKHQPEMVQSTILISPVHYGFPGGAGMIPAQREMALADKEAGKLDELVQYKISFCDKYTTVRSNYLAITDIDENAIIERFKSIQSKLNIVYGTRDEALNKSFRDKIYANGLTIEEVLDGNHFFSGPSEFDLHETILSLVSGNAS